ncbi:MAG: hypothetical protein IK031_07475 [Bacteroidales bacterium]|nr:hypothetical protein [Bacteroidales bacterium]
MSIRRQFTTLLLAAGMAAGMAVSCDKALEGTEAGQQDKVYEFTCVIASEEPEGKVSISEQGKPRWEVGDEILVHGGGKSNRTVVKLTAADISSDGRTAKIAFSGVTPYDRSSDGVTSTFYAAYPASALSSSDLYWYATFTQTNLPLMAAYNDGSTFKFYNCCGAISFKVSGDFDSYEFEGLNGETVAYDQYEVKLVKKSSASLDFHHWVDNPQSVVSGSVKADGSTVNYVFLPEGVNFTGGFKFKFKKNGSLVKVASSTKPVDVARSKLLPLGDISSHLKDPSASDTHQSQINTSIATDLSENGTANCYIVSKAGTYKFPAVKGNGTQSAGTVASVEVLWETTCTANAPGKGSVIKDVDFQDRYIYFETPSTLTPGNALIAAKNASGAIIWSWHIWIPATTITTGTYNLAWADMMDRNLGALVAAPSGGDGRCFGLFYQWGRKDPFPGMQSISSSSVVGVSGTSTSVIQLLTPENNTTTIAQTIANPTVFYTVKNKDWNSVADDDLWGGNSGKKTIYDPCPPGYKVATDENASGLFTTLTDVTGWSSNVSAGYFQAGSPAATFPYAGYIDDYIEAPGSYANTGIRAMIWSAQGSSEKAYGLDVRSDVSTDTAPISAIRKANPKARGGSVRCVSENLAPFQNEAGMPVMGSSHPRTEFAQKDMSELSGLCFSKDGDFMWAVGDNGNLYQIGFDMTVTTKFSKSYDMEGITIDPSTADLYFCDEPNGIYKIAAPNYTTVTYLFSIAEAANMGNSGLEGITYYKNNVIYAGSQSGATLWAYDLNGTKIWKKQLGTIAPGIQEVGDLYYDAQTDLLWVSDSEAFKLFVFDGAVTKLKAVYDISFIGNPESVLVDHARSCVWVGDDRGSSSTNTDYISSRIYKISFSNLGGGSSQATAQTLCKTECLGQKPMVVAYLTEYTSASTLNADFVTHINYAHGRFANPDTGDGGIVISETSLLKKVLALKQQKPTLKVLLMIGGWGAKANGFSQMASDPAKRTAFCQSCLNHIQTYGLDGIDIDWEYPTYSAEGNAASPDDIANFNLVLRELRETIGDTKIISFASADSAKYMDWTTAIKYIDYVNVMTYSMGNPPYHNSPLYQSSIARSRSCEESIELHRKAGIPLTRMNFGVPFYGHAISPYNSEVKFYEMASIINNHYYEKGKIDVTGQNIRVWDDDAQVPYIADTSGKMLICYDDEESVALKGAFAREKGLLGAMVWEYRCDDDDHTLMRTLYNAVYGK